MKEFNQPPISVIEIKNKVIYSFLNKETVENSNIDWVTVDSFGNEWEKFSEFSEEELNKIGNDYFDVAYSKFNNQSVVLEVGSGSGRWMKFLAPKVSEIHGIDPSNSVVSASHYLMGIENYKLSQAAVDNIPYEDESFDFVYSLGVLHHIPDTKKAMGSAIKKLKVGGYFLVYLYYSLDNRSFLFKKLFWLSNLIRLVVSKLNFNSKAIVCDLLAVLVYMPFVLLSRFFFEIGLKEISKRIPLSYYRDKSFEIIRNDSLDRFGTPLEQRFSKKEIEQMMKSNGLDEIEFSTREPYWHAIGKRII